jgi:methionine-rich copper-binding protein CopC
MYSRYSIVLSTALTVLVLQGNGRPAWAHAYPALSIPNNGATVKEPPREVRIQFTEGIELVFSQIIVKGPNGEVVSQGKLRKLTNDIIAVDLKPLRPGNYTVEWQVLSLDTHVTEGVLRFTVAPQGN